MIKKLRFSLAVSICGLKTAFLKEKSFRYEVFLALLSLPLALVFKITNSHRLWIFFSTFLILIVELLNTGIEKIIDGFGNPHKDEFKFAKDAGSAAVFLSLIFLCIVWVLVLI